MADLPIITTPISITATNKRARVDSVDLESTEFDSPEVKRLRDDLFENLEDNDIFEKFEKSLEKNSDLDDFMKSFENEILAVEKTELPELGFLLEASDDELGIPPVKTELGLNESWSYGDEFKPSYNSTNLFEYGDASNYEFSELGFDNYDTGLDLYEAPLPLWRPETTPAL